MPATTLATPATDDRLICDLTDRVTGAFAIAIAHDAGVFQVLSEAPRTAGELCAVLSLAGRKAEALLDLCVAAGLVRRCEGRFSLTAVAADYLVEGSPTYMGYLFELWSDDDAPFTFQNLRRSILEADDASALCQGRQLWSGAHQRDFTRARRFTRMMHGHSMAPALAWTEQFDLHHVRRMIDVGGGSAAHAIGAALRWPRLEAVVVDLPAVCAVADDYIAQYELQDRIRSQPSDMWSDPLPRGDLHFYSDVFHNWSKQEGARLARKSFEQLPAGGRIMIHEMLYDDDKSGPFTVAASSMAMLTWCGGQQYSGPELTAMLRDAGFSDIAVTPTFGYWSIVSGWKR